MPPPPTSTDRVLVLASTTERGPLRAAVQHLAENGAQVLVVTPAVTESSTPEAQVHNLDAAARSHGPAFRRALHAAGPRQKLGVYLRSDAWVHHWLPHVDVVLPLDPVAAEATRHLLRHQNLPATVADGVDEALHHLQTRPARQRPHEGAGPLPADARRHLAEADPTLSGPDDLARARHVAGLAIAALADRDELRAEALVRGAAAELTSPRLRADLLGDVVSWSLARGLPVRLARDAYAAELICADKLLTAGEHKQAASSFMEAVRTAYHPVLHLHHTYSPLANDPLGYTAPLRTSIVAARLRGEDQTGRSQPPAARSPAAPAQRPLRLFLGTHSDPSFLSHIRTHFGDHPDVETRSTSFADAPALQQFGRRQAPFVAEVLSGGERLPASLEESFREHLDWADVAFVEWFTATAALLSRMDRRGTRVIARFHSWEAFSWWPHLVDVRGLDDVVFVSDHLRDFAQQTIPGLALPNGPRLHVLTNAVDLRRTVRPKSGNARFTLAVVGASRVVKDPRWAVEVVRLLRRHDDRYRLLLIRGTVDDEGPATRRYIEDMHREIAALPPDAVEVTAHTDDLPTVLQDVGVVISSSVRESFHIGLVEGAASGALPVVRDWPYFPGAAARLFPSDWVVGTPAEAAGRIIAETSDVGHWRTATAEAADHALGTWDWSVVQAQYERLFSATGG